MDFNWQIVFPEITILATAAGVLLIDLFVRRARVFLFTAVSFVGVMVTLWLIFGSFSLTGVSFFGAVVNDPIAFYFKIIFCLGTLLTLFISATYVRREIKWAGEYYALILISTFGMMVMASSCDLITIFLGLEVMSIPLYVLAGIYRERPRAREASMKYFLLGAFASGFLLYGIALTFGAYGTTNLLTISERFGSASDFTRILSSAGLMLILIGLGFKVAVAPFHMWVPDVYEGAAAPITAFMSAGPKAAAFAALFRIFSLYSPIEGHDFTLVLWILAVATMTWGNILAVSQRNIKRMLAYSSIAHAGYVMIALTVGHEQGLAAGAFYLLAYAMMNIGAFAVIILFSGKGEKFEEIKDYAGFGIRYPFAGVALTVFMLSLAGVPATAGFIGKYKIFMAAINSGYIWLAVIGVLNSLISVWYYIGVVVTMYMKPAKDEMPAVSISPSLMVAISVALLATLQLGLIPGVWLRFADLAGRYSGWASILNAVIGSL